MSVQLNAATTPGKQAKVMKNFVCTKRKLRRAMCNAKCPVAQIDTAAVCIVLRNSENWGPISQRNAI